MCNLRTFMLLQISTALLDISLTTLNSTDKSNNLCNANNNLLLITFHMSILINSTGPVLLITLGSMMIQFQGKIERLVFSPFHADGSRCVSLAAANDCSIRREHLGLDMLFRPVSYYYMNLSCAANAGRCSSSPQLTANRNVLPTGRNDSVTQNANGQSDEMLPC